MFVQVLPLVVTSLPDTTLPPTFHPGDLPDAPIPFIQSRLRPSSHANVQARTHRFFFYSFSLAVPLRWDPTCVCQAPFYPDALVLFPLFLAVLLTNQVLRFPARITFRSTPSGFHYFVVPFLLSEAARAPCLWRSNLFWLRRRGYGFQDRCSLRSNFFFFFCGRATCPDRKWRVVWLAF